MEFKSTSPQELHHSLANDQTIQLIDVRTPAEFESLHAAAARNVPLDRLDPEQFRAAVAKGEKLVFICKSGARGRQACEKMAGCGLTNVMNVTGGTDAWNNAGLPVVRGRKTISLERQVRIVAGLLTFTGALLSYFAHPYFVVIPAFIGAGLTFAGITDTCGMGMILARMPWNQRGA